ncbi:hypothetical protein K9M06_02880 [Candidatus Bipolaricaulota bacterium]|nr:hypothetical protein [Candidatus Bipolaricaulota bacterium]
MPLWFELAAVLVSVFGTGITIYLIRPLLVEAGLTGVDLHKDDGREIAEMGGLGIIVGVSGGFVLAIGALLASAVIIGDFETAGVVIIIPYFVDFLLKAMAGFPSEDWAGEINPEDGKLYCPREFPMSFPQLVMKMTGGIKERYLVLTMMGIEGVAGLVAISLYLV